MTARLEWANTSAYTEVLYPGAEVDGAVVDPGEIALAWWTGSHGIALSAPSPHALADHLEFLAGKLRTLPVPLTAQAHISAGLDPAVWAPGVDQDPDVVTLKSPVQGPALCEDAGPIVTDPRCATCPQCLDAWNDHLPAPRTPIPLFFQLT